MEETMTDTERKVVKNTLKKSERTRTSGKKMKQFFILVLILFVAVPLTLNAQEKTLFRGDFESGGYCGPSFKFTAIEDDFAYLAGIGGTWLIDHRVTLGGAFYWLESDIETTVSGTVHDIDMGYGGFELGYVFLPERLVHFNVHTLIGGGEVSSENSITDDSEDDGFFVVEPNLDMELNVTSWFRLLSGVSYRFVDGVQGVPGISDNDLRGFSGVISLKFGWF
jgi:hypothetical protein